MNELTLLNALNDELEKIAEKSDAGGAKAFGVGTLAAKGMDMYKKKKDKEHRRKAFGKAYSASRAEGSGRAMSAAKGLGAKAKAAIVGRKKGDVEKGIDTAAKAAKGMGKTLISGKAADTARKGGKAVADLKAAMSGN